MPLLGRHKSSASNSPSPSSSASSPPGTGAINNRQPASVASRQQLCESPLFGIRRQLPTQFSDCGSNSSSSNNNLVGQQATGSGANKQQHQQQQQQQQQLQSVNSTVISSIPQQITRQQIHYAFSIMDSNKDGQVDVRDLSQMLSNLGVPIDEAILSHIMTNTVSKRGDHRISEAEFLDWISHFIEIIRSDPPPPPPQALAAKSRQTTDGQQRPRGATTRTAVRATRSSTAGSSLVAQPSEVPRARRGSGSGLALMRSLSSSNAATGAASSSTFGANPNVQQLATERSQTCDRHSKRGSSTSGSAAQKQWPSSTKAPLERQSSSDSAEAKNDLKAAFCVFDLDGDGYITLDEVRAGLKLLGESWSPLELRNLFSSCNSNSNLSPTSDLQHQRISIDDFVQLLL